MSEISYAQLQQEQPELADVIKIIFEYKANLDSHAPSLQTMRAVFVDAARAGYAGVVQQAISLAEEKGIFRIPQELRVTPEEILAMLPNAVSNGKTLSLEYIAAMNKPIQYN